MTVAVHYDWLRHVPQSLFEIEDAPFFGHPPPFPWEQFAAVFSKVFQLENAKLTPSTWEVRLPENLYSGLGSNPISHFIDLAPLKGELCFAMANEDLQHLMNFFLVGDIHAPTLIDSDYQQGFYQFLALEVFNIFSKLEYAKGIVPHLIEPTNLSAEPCVCLDISIEIRGQTFVGRLIVSNELRFAWKERFTQNSLTIAVPPEIQVIVQLEAGSVILSRAEWNQIEVGDFLFLDQCSLEDQGEKGRVIMTLYGKSLYRAKVKDGQLKILESPFFHEVQTEISPLSTQEESTLPDNTFDEEFTDFEDEFTDLEHTELGHTELEHTGESDAPPTRTDAPPRSTESEDHSREIAAKGVSEATKAAPGAPLSINDVPLTVVVEVGRIQISLQKLMELQPGNLLDLDIHPEKGIDLVVNGIVIGKGELLKLGDSLGVRILDKV